MHGTLDELLTVDDLARILRISRRGVYNAVAAGEVPVIRIRGRLRFDREAIQEWLRTVQGDARHTATA